MMSKDIEKWEFAKSESANDFHLQSLFIILLVINQLKKYFLVFEPFFT